MKNNPPHEPENSSLQKRVAQLENDVAKLQAQVRQLHQTITRSASPVQTVPSATKARKTAVSPPLSPSPQKQQPATPNPYLQGEFWLNKVGIGLLLFSLIFLFKFAVDQGWLTPPVRVIIGLLLGTGLLLLGLRIYKKRRHFSLVLLGGSVASYYITGFAAFQLYELISQPVAFGFMFLVTMLAFSLSLYQNEAIFALIGALGGFGTPFLLSTGGSNIQGLIFYTCILISGTVTIYFFRGWRVLLWTAATLGWMIMWAGTYEATSSATAVSADKWALQTGLLFAWIAFWGVPLFRQLLNRNGDSTLNPLSIGIGDAYLPTTIKQWLSNDLHFFAFTTIFLLLGSSIPLWELSNNQQGILFLSFALLYSLIALNLRRIPSLATLGITYAFTATMLLTVALFLLLEDANILLIALMIELIIWHFFNHRLQNKWVQVSTHFFSALLAYWLLVRLSGIGGGRSNTAVYIITDLFIILSFVGIAIAWLRSRARSIYLLAAHIAILMLFWRELSVLTNGQGVVSIAWGIYAIALLFIGLRYHLNRVRTVAFATLFLLVGKLFLIDLANVKPIWRILLFFGFGGVFLLLSYFYQTVRKSEADTKSS